MKTDLRKILMKATPETKRRAMEESRTIVDRAMSDTKSDIERAEERRAEHEAEKLRLLRGLQREKRRAVQDLADLTKGRGHSPTPPLGSAWWIPVFFAAFIYGVGNAMLANWWHAGIGGFICGFCFSQMFPAAPMD